MIKDTLREWPSYTASYQLPMRYLHQGQGAGTVILLHGYQDHALSMTRRMGWLGADLPFSILAVNAPFPVPIWKPEGFVEAYSWYFRDTTRDLMIVNPAESAKKVAAIAELTGVDKGPIILFGFSQGGVLAPFVAKLLPSTMAILAVGSGYPAEPYAELNKSIRVFGIHADQDDRWPLMQSMSTHSQLISNGFEGEFHVIPGLGHRVDPMIDPLIRKIIAETFGDKK